MKINNHYLPECYLKGFTDENELFYVYDKVTGKIRYDKPKNVFSEKYKFAIKFYEQHKEELSKLKHEHYHYHNGEIDNKDDANLLEDTYWDFENDWIKTIKGISDLDFTRPIVTLAKEISGLNALRALVGERAELFIKAASADIDNRYSLHDIKDVDIKLFDELSDYVVSILDFITNTYWRIPSNDDEYQDLLAAIKPEDLPFTIFDNKKPIEREFIENFIQTESFQKSYRLILASQPFFQLDGSQKVFEFFKNFDVLHHDNILAPICDNPLIMKSEQNLIGEVIMPLSSNRTLIAINKVDSIKKKQDSYLIDFLLTKDILLFAQAERNVCCKDKKYLEYLVSNYKNKADDQYLSALKRKLFDILK